MAVPPNQPRQRGFAGMASIFPISVLLSPDPGHKVKMKKKSLNSRPQYPAEVYKRGGW